METRHGYWFVPGGSRILTEGARVALVMLLGAAWLACGGGSGPGGNEDAGVNQNGAVCNDGVKEGTEECDDGADNSDSVPDACRTDCTLPRCGDSVKDTDEECDEGPANSDAIPDACRADCTLPRCGDGVVDIAAGETCDPGPDLPTEICGTTCMVRYCGNHVIEGDEVCDDGNWTPGDGCSPDCRSDETCGNGIVDGVSQNGGEECDDGNTDAGDGCSANCRVERCGNGIVEDQEVCDDGNNMPGDDCSADCRSNETCGNGVVDALKGESCDCGTTTLPTACVAAFGATTAYLGCEGNSTFEDISGTGALAGYGDENTWPASLGFTFSFFGQSYTDVTLSANGVLAFATGSVTYSNRCLPATTLTVPAVAAFWDDLRSQSGQGVYYQTLGTAGTRRFVAQWVTGHYNVAGAITFQVVLHEATGQVELRYQDVTFGSAAYDQGRSATVGITAGPTGPSLAYSCNGATLQDGQSLILLPQNPPPGCVTYNGIPGGTCNDQCLPVYCGNGIQDFGEVCDDGNKIGGDGCSADCRSDETCGNGIVDVISQSGSEQCDLGTANSNAPDALCRTDCSLRRCGDGIIDPGASEICEPDVTLTQTCAGLGFYGAPAGTLACGPTCRYDTAGCLGWCGDGLVNGPEHCDGAALGSGTCADFGYYSGTLSCSPLCGYVSTGCSEYCGDDIINGPEYCDGRPPDGDFCLTFGYDYGRLECQSSCTPTVQHCRWYGWEDMGAPYWWYNGIWGLSSDNLIAVADGGYTAHWNGTSWRGVPNPTGQNLKSVWGTAMDNVWAVGLGGTIIHWNGTSWTDQSPGTTSNLQRIEGRGNLALAVGSGGTILRNRGSGWENISNPAYTNELWGVAFYSDTSAYVVGGSGRILRIENLDTTPAFTVMTTTNGTLIRGVWASGRNNAWAVGWQQFIHYDGNASNQWTEFEPGLTAGANWWNVYGLDANNVYAVGSSGAIVTFDGNAWEWMDPETGAWLTDVWALNRSEIFTVGNVGKIVKYRGSSIGALTKSQTGIDFWRLWGPSSRDVFFAATGGMYRYNSAGFTTMVEGGNYGGEDIWGSSASNVYVVGGDGTEGNGTGGKIFRYNGTSWSTQTIPAGDDLKGIWGSGPSSIWAVGVSGRVLHWNGSSWAVTSVGTTAHLRGVWGSGPNDVYAVGNGRTVLHFNGTSWASAAPTGSQILRRVWGTGTGEVFAVGDSGYIFHYDGSTWSQMDSPVTVTLLGLWGFSATDVFAVGNQGKMIHYDGVAWSPFRTDFGGGTRGVWGEPDTIYVVGQWNTLLRLHRPNLWQ